MEPWRHIQSSDAFEEGRLYGVYPGIVTNNKDPENRARVKVKFPWLSEAEESWWARVATFYAGRGRGSYLMPEVDDEVLVCFEHGDFHFPYVVGALWNGVDKVPGPGNPDGQNNVKHFQSRCGHKLVFDDTAGAEKISLIDSSGNNSVVIDVAADTISVTAQTGDIFIEAPAGKINVGCVDLNVTAHEGGTGTYSVGNDHTLGAKSQSTDVSATQDIKVGAKMDHATPSMKATISGTFALTSSNTQVEALAVEATLASTVLTQGSVTKTLKQEVAEVGTYTLNTTSAQMAADKMAVVAAAAHTVNGATISADGTESCVVGGGSVVVAGGMVVFKGSSVMTQGSV
ncbi:MAG TPA: phage baseplate assembly protein V [Myxococcota bacterium]|nr:phage baseplate assembly protein V [Myxococcota bacterium]